MRIDNRGSLRAFDGLLSYPTILPERRSPGLWRCLATALRTASRQRREAEELAALSDRMLADIGLTRADLPPRRRAPPLDALG